MGTYSPWFLVQVQIVHTVNICTQTTQATYQSTVRTIIVCTVGPYEGNNISSYLKDFVFL